MSGPNLSQYFSDNPPSLFDVLGGSGTNTVNANVPVVGNEVPSHGPGSYVSNASCAPESDGPNIPDDVKDCWEPALVEPGIPPTLTMPGVAYANDMEEVIKEHAMQLGTDNNQKKMLGADDVTQDERGLRTLIEAGSYKSAVNLTKRFLTVYGQGFGREGQPTKHSPHSLQLWFTRFALLMKLGMYDVLQTESEPFGWLNRPDVFFEFYPEMYPGRKGSMAPFSLRLLLAELPTYIGAPKLALDRLTDMYLICSTITQFYKPDQPAAYEFWQRREIRVVHALINCTLQMKDFNLADTLIEKLTDNEQLDNAQKKALYSAWGRIYLQCGDVFGAERKFSEARRIRETSSESELRDTIDKGLIAVAQNDFQTAQASFDIALKLEPTNAMLLNNLGVCCLYSGRLKDAIHYFEMAVKLNFKNGLSESLLLNLSTLYELESSSDAKKMELFSQIKQHVSDQHVNLGFCLKLQTAQKTF